MACGEFEFLGLGGVFERERDAMSGRKLLAKLAAEVGDLQDAQRVFIRTLKMKRSRLEIEVSGFMLM